jgi:hypothetical protein
MIRVENVIDFIDKLIKNTNNSQLLASFQIMDKMGRGYIDANTFQQFVIDCWIAAFRNLNSMIQKSGEYSELKNVSLESWASSKKADIIVQVQKEFMAFDSSKSGVGTV